MRDSIEDAVQTALRKRLDEEGYDDSRQLLGECTANTEALCRELDARGIDHTVVCGGIPRIRRISDPPESAEQAKEQGNHHYWVEAHGYLCELASESERFFGQPVVTSIYPQHLHYVVFDDSKDHTLD